MVSERHRQQGKGLCFCCAEPFRPGHRCAVTSFALLDVDKDSLPLKDQCDLDITYAQEEADTQLASNATLKEEAPVAFNAILGLPSTTTMKIRGSLQDKSVLLLVDIGSAQLYIYQINSESRPLHNYNTIFWCSNCG